MEEEAKNKEEAEKKEAERQKQQHGESIGGKGKIRATCPEELMTEGLWEWK